MKRPVTLHGFEMRWVKPDLSEIEDVVQDVRLCRGHPYGQLDVLDVAFGQRLSFNLVDLLAELDLAGEDVLALARRALERQPAIKQRERRRRGSASLPTA